jgi:Bacterial regulatory helix-turn-helix proteins, AraC family.
MYDGLIQLEVLIRKMQEGSAVAFLPEPYYVCEYVTAPAEKCISVLWDALSENQPKEKDFAGIGELKKLRREMHKAPELDWNLGELAKRLNISKSYVQKLYKENFGISYIDDLIAR